MILSYIEIQVMSNIAKINNIIISSIIDEILSTVCNNYAFHDLSLSL